jgi:hypothetical protein
VRDYIGTSVFKSFQHRASQPALVIKSASLSTEGDIQAALNDMQQSGYRYVYATLDETNYKVMLPKALERGLAPTPFDFPAAK